MYLSPAPPSPKLGAWNLSTFSEWLQTARERRGLSQRALAQKTNVSSAMVSRVESGDVGASPEMVERFAEALEVPRSIALKAWLSDRLDGEEITREADPDLEEVTYLYEGLPNDNKATFKTLLRQFHEAKSGYNNGGKSDRDTRDGSGEGGGG